MSGKIRLDLLLVKRGLCPSRQRARDAVLEGGAFVEGRRADKPSQLVPEESEIDLRAPQLPYVSRGGLKLEKAMDLWKVGLSGQVCLDVGASTGGFTDCMLQRGAAKVYAVDAGRNQLSPVLRDDPRVVSLENTNARYLTKEQIPQPVDFAAVDVSFISLKLILPPLSWLVKPEGRCICLIKPQFEAGRGKVGKRGVVRDPAVHREVLERFSGSARENGFSVVDLDFSPIKGPEGNIEYLGLLSHGGLAEKPVDLGGLVERSHRELA